MKKQNQKKINRKKIKKSPFKWVSIGLIVLIVLTIALYFKIGNDRKYDGELSEPRTTSFTKDGQLAFIRNETNDTIKVIDIEIAADDAKRAQGLMWRWSMSEHRGMLFIHENEGPLSFWMKNTYIPLDIIYVNAAQEIVTIRENNTPLSEQSIPSEVPAQYVVEVVAGFCHRHNIAIGDKIEFEVMAQ